MPQNRLQYTALQGHKCEQFLVHNEKLDYCGTGKLLTIAEQKTQAAVKSASLDRDLEYAVREYLRTYDLWRGIGQATATLGVSAKPCGDSSNEATWGTPCPMPS